MLKSPTFLTFMCFFRRISYDELEEHKKNKTESGYCWELRDHNLDKVIGRYK